MKNYYLLIFTLLTQLAFAQDPFIFTWEIINSSSVTIPVAGTNNSYTVDFGDGIVLTGQTSAITHQYSSVGIFTVTLSGDFNKVNFGMNVSNTNGTLKTIEQWGDTQWSSMENAFYGCLSLIINATDAPNLANCTDLSNMFANSGMNQNVNHWDVSTITNMSGMFANPIYNQPLNNWDVSNVIDMSRMFSGAHLFNQPIDSWDVSSVTNMSQMFFNAFDYNQPMNNWDVSSVTDMSYMFTFTPDFNQDISSWDVSAVTTMASMFARSFNFNHPLGNWDVSNVTDMRNMFYEAETFNQDINSWNVQSVTNMRALFYSAWAFNSPLSDWDVSNVTNMAGAFDTAINFDQDLSNWSFNPDVIFYELEGIEYDFVQYSGLSVENYDALLARFAALGIQDKTLRADLLHYCDVATRSYLIDEKGFMIINDTLAEDCTASTETFDNNLVTIYPNPVGNELNIRGDVQIKDVTIYNTHGSKVLEQNITSETINTSGLSAGVYILSITTETGTSQFKIVKQ